MLLQSCKNGRYFGDEQVSRALVLTSRSAIQDTDYRVLLLGKIEDRMMSDDEMTADDIQDEERGAMPSATRNTEETNDFTSFGTSNSQVRQY